MITQRELKMLLDWQKTLPVANLYTVLVSCYINGLGAAMTDESFEEVKADINRILRGGKEISVP